MKDNLVIITKYTFICIISLFFDSAYSFYIPEGKSNFPINSFAFGSCYNGFLAERFDIFKTILDANPDLFVFNGDVTYLDNFDYNLVFNIPPQFNSTEAKIRFDDTFNNPFYSLFRKNKPIVGIWDDHDYGHNSADISFPHKNITKRMFLDFLEYPYDHPKRIENNGIQSSYSFGEGFKSVKVILLDLRFFLNYTEMLGEEQWKWLEEELKTDETFTFLVSGVQLLPANRPFMLECWSLEGRQRLVELLSKLKKSGVIILSGDIHFGETLKTPCIHPSKSFIN